MDRLNLHISDSFLILFCLAFVGVLAFRGQVDPALVAASFMTFATTAYRAVLLGKRNENL